MHNPCQSWFFLLLFCPNTFGNVREGVFLCLHETILRGDGKAGKAVPSLLGKHQMHQLQQLWGGVPGTDLATGCAGLCSWCSLRRCLLYREPEHFTRSLQVKHSARPCGTGQGISSSCVLEHIFKYITLYFSSNCTVSSRSTVRSCACVVMAITAVSSFQRKGPVI